MFKKPSYKRASTEYKRPSAEIDSMLDSATLYAQRKTADGKYYPSHLQEDLSGIFNRRMPLANQEDSPFIGALRKVVTEGLEGKENKRFDSGTAAELYLRDMVELLLKYIDLQVLTVMTADELAQLTTLNSLVGQDDYQLKLNQDKLKFMEKQLKALEQDEKKNYETSIAELKKTIATQQQNIDAQIAKYKLSFNKMKKIVETCVNFSRQGEKCVAILEQKQLEQEQLQQKQWSALQPYLNIFKFADEKLAMNQVRTFCSSLALYEPEPEAKDMSAKNMKGLVVDCIDFLNRGSRGSSDPFAEVARGQMAQQLYICTKDPFNPQTICERLTKCLIYIHEKKMHVSKEAKAQAEAILNRHPELKERIKFKPGELDAFVIQVAPMLGQLEQFQKSASRPGMGVRKG